MTTKVVSDSTGETFEIDEKILSWKGTGVEERDMGPEKFYEAHESRTASDGSKVTITWSASVYPRGAPREIFSVEVSGGRITE